MDEAKRLLREAQSYGIPSELYLRIEALLSPAPVVCPLCGQSYDPAEHDDCPYGDCPPEGENERE